MTWELVSSGDGGNIRSVIEDEENYIEEGQRAQLICECNVNVPQGTIDNLRNQLEWAGVADLEVIGEGSTVTVSWRKGMPWLAVIIPIIIALLVILAIVIVVWQFLKDTTIPDPFKWGIVLAGCAMAAGLAYFLFRRKY